jgi:hypothetical protein
MAKKVPDCRKCLRENLDEGVSITLLNFGFLGARCDSLCHAAASDDDTAIP